MTKQIFLLLIFLFSTSAALFAEKENFDPEREILEAEIRMAEKKLMGIVTEVAEMEATLAAANRTYGSKHPSLVELTGKFKLLMEARQDQELLLRQKLHEKRDLLEHELERSANLGTVRVDIDFQGGNALSFVESLEKELENEVRQPFNVVRAGNLKAVELPAVVLKKAKLEHVAKTVEIVSEGGVTMDFDSELLVVNSKRKRSVLIPPSSAMTTVISLAPLVAGLPSQENRMEAMEGLDQLILKSFDIGGGNVPRLAIDPRTDSLIVQGTPDQIEQVKSIVEVFGKHLAYTGGERTEERRIDVFLRETILDLNFVDTPFSEVVEYLRQVTEQADPKMEAGVNYMIEGKLDDKPLTLKLRSVPLVEGLKYISEVVEVKYRVDDHVVVFYSSSDDPFGG
ncbi:MAG: hypothetical protein AAGJ79_00695 [Verrucomicrobiota bacterium]